MNRLLVNRLIDKDGTFLISKNSGKITISDGVNANVLLLSIPEKDDFQIKVGNNVTLTISFLIKENINNKKVLLDAGENSNIQIYFADFSLGKAEFAFVGNLLQRNTSLNWHLASLSANSDNKTFDISVNHIAGSTFARMDNYGVCKDDARLVFSGISTINNGAKESKTHQNSKIMVFDEKSDGIAKPILKIDENDIEASHAAVVGKINDDHLFYLTSRGLSESAAKELITFGYLKPIMNGFVEEDIKEEISKLIEERM